VRRRKKGAIVPRAVRAATFAAVVPACAIACSGPDPILSLHNQVFGVAAVAFCCFDSGGVAADAFVVDSSPPFDSGDSGGDAPSDGSDEPD
jgi:hypothetical protein